VANKKKKETKVQKTLRLFNKHTKGGMKPADAVKQLAKELKISERLVRSYLWRARNPEKFKACVDRYFEKKRKAKEKAKDGKVHIETNMTVKGIEPTEEIKNNM
jgi:predicted solute-binding protein